MSDGMFAQRGELVDEKGQLTRRGWGFQFELWQRTGGAGGVADVPHGGTGIPAFAVGDMIYASAVTTLARLAAVAAGSVLLSGAIPSWGKVPLATHVSGILPTTSGGTGIPGYASGDLPYASALNTLSKLSIGASGKVLQSNGTIPGWSAAAFPTTGGAAGQFLRSDGTNALWSNPTIPTTGTAGGVPWFSSTTALSSSALLGSTQIVLGGGAGGAPNTSANRTFDGTTDKVIGNSVIQQGSISLMIGADTGATTLTNATAKAGLITLAHYTNAQPPVALIGGSATSSQNIVDIGGGSSLENAATLVRFYAGPNNTTTTGTEQGRYTNGIWTIGASASSALLGIGGRLQITHANTVVLTAENTVASSASSGAFVGLYSNDGAAMALGDRLGGFLLGGASSASSLRNSALIAAFATQNWVDASAYGSRLDFELIPDGSTTRAAKMRLLGAARLYIGGAVDPTATLHLAAGTTAASTAPLKFTSGSLLTTAEALAVEALTDKAYFTITTGAVRKELALNDIALTTGRLVQTTTNGRLTDSATLTVAADVITAAGFTGPLNGTLGATTPNTIAATTGAFSSRVYVAGSAPVLYAGDWLRVDAAASNVAGVFTTQTAGYEPLALWNKATVGNNLFASFNTEGTITPRGTVDYDRANDRLRLTGSAGGLSFGASVFSAAAYFSGVGTTASAANAYLDNGSSPANNLLRSTSSLRYKTGVQIIERDEAVDIVLKIAEQAMSYQSLAAADDKFKRHLGFGAENMHAIDQRLVTYSKGIPESVQYERIAVLHSVMLADHEYRLRAMEQRPH